jgi:hypothetical protein
MLLCPTIAATVPGGSAAGAAASDVATFRTWAMTPPMG